MNRLIFIVIALSFALSASAQIEMEDDSLLEVSDEMQTDGVIDAMSTDMLLDSLIEMQIDSMVNYVDTLNMSPEERWVWHLRQNIDSVIRHKRTATVTQRVSRRSRRTVKRTVTYNYTLGCCVYDLSADSMLYTHNPALMLKPASTQKLFVSISALSTLGRDYTFDTDIYGDGEVLLDSLQHPYYKGNIYVHGGFDPTLTFSDLRQIADTLRSLGVDSIDGGIYADVPLKSRLLADHRWTWDGVPPGEEYFITPLSFNKGMTSADVPRDPVWVTRGKGRKARRVLTVPAFKSTRTKHPEQYFVSSLYQLLKADSIKFSSDKPYGVILTDSMASVSKTSLLRIKTPIAKVMHTMMKRSDNFYAESMLLNLCSPDNAAWTYDRCKKSVRDMVTRSEGQQDEYQIVDGSGLSHSNYSTPQLEIQILRYAFHDPDIYIPLYESLPIAGVDGTISKRMKTGRVYNNVRAKTGTLNGVSALTGYVTASNGHELAFAIMVNSLGSQAIGHALQDEICEQLVK